MKNLFYLPGPKFPSPFPFPLSFSPARLPPRSLPLFPAWATPGPAPAPSSSSLPWPNGPLAPVPYLQHAPATTRARARRRRRRAVPHLSAPPQHLGQALERPSHRPSPAAARKPLPPHGSVRSPPARHVMPARHDAASPAAKVARAHCHTHARGRAHFTRARHASPPLLRDPPDGVGPASTPPRRHL